MKKPKPLLAPLPYQPAPYDDNVTRALKALADGRASEGQQQLALRWIVEAVCGTYDQPFRPAGDRETVFACAKMFVGQQIVKQINRVMPTEPQRG